MSKRNTPVEKRRRRDARNKRKAIALRAKIAEAEVRRRMYEDAAARRAEMLRHEEDELAAEFIEEVESDDFDETEGTDGLEHKTMAELRDIASEEELPKRSSYRTKPAMIIAIRMHRESVTV